MPQLTPEQERQAIAEAPKGTWAILIVYALIMSAAWAYMFFGLFLSHGPVN